MDLDPPAINYAFFLISLNRQPPLLYSAFWRRKKVSASNQSASTFTEGVKAKCYLFRLFDRSFFHAKLVLLRHEPFKKVIECLLCVLLRGDQWMAIFSS